MNEKLSLDQLNRLSVEEFKKVKKHPVVLVLDNIRSMHNVGSIFRTADAFAVEHIYLCGITGQPPNKELHKTALGSENSVSWKYYTTTIDCVRDIKQQGYSCFAVEQTTKSIMLDQINELKGKIALIFGNEVQGVDEAVIQEVDGVIEIPQYGTKHSLNVAVSAGIITWEICRRMKGAY